jgi:hypothetical protein
LFNTLFNIYLPLSLPNVVIKSLFYFLSYLSDLLSDVVIILIPFIKLFWDITVLDLFIDLDVKFELDLLTKSLHGRFALWSSNWSTNWSLNTS